MFSELKSLSARRPAWLTRDPERYCLWTCAFLGACRPYGAAQQWTVHKSPPLPGAQPEAPAKLFMMCLQNCPYSSGLAGGNRSYRLELPPGARKIQKLSSSYLGFSLCLC